MQRNKLVTAIVMIVAGFIVLLFGAVTATVGEGVGKFIVAKLNESGVITGATDYTQNVSSIGGTIFTIGGAVIMIGGVIVLLREIWGLVKSTGGV